MTAAPPAPFRAFAGAGHDACGTGFLADRTGRPRGDILPLALTALGRMEHRGGLGADGETGDGAGILTAIPWAILAADPACGIDPAPAAHRFGVGSVFLPQNAAERGHGVRLVERGLALAGLSAIAWREVPVNDAVLGRFGRASRPGLAHVIVARPEGLDAESFEHRLFLARREAAALARSAGLPDLYLASLSHRTIVYKALLRASQLREFYDDLRNPAFATPFAVFHNRFSTNTHPSWPRTQPFRQLAHNGEINTIDGNRRWMEARGIQGAGRALGLSPSAASPLLAPDESDSASLDEALRLLMTAGRPTFEALRILVPPAWENDASMSLATRAFYDLASRAMEPWDGPALVAFTDGRVVGAALDRNGLRPARTVITVDKLVMVASEAGVLDVPEERIAERSRLGPGDFLGVDLEKGELVDREALDQRLGFSSAGLRPAATDVAGVVEGAGIEFGQPRRTEVRALSAFGYTREELQFVIGPMARDGVDPIGSMGDDIPLACLSEKPRLLFSFFKQRFAQVTNPPIDPLREQVAMSLRTWLGPAPNLGAAGPPPEGINLRSPVLTEGDLEGIARREDDASAGLSLLFCALPDAGETEMARALDRVLWAAVRDARQGALRLILSDRGVDSGHAAIPSLLAVSAVHQRLVREGLRLGTSLIVETGEARDDHQIATLLGFGANAVCPYGAFEAVRRWAEEHEPQHSPEAGIRNVVRTLEKGLLKILSKMGIATSRSYQGAQLFEAIGLDRHLVDRHFTGTPVLLEGHGIAEIARDVLSRHRHAYGEAFGGLDEGGAHRYRRSGEAHAFEPPVVKALHALIRSGETLDARRYSELIEQRSPIAVRDLLRFREAAEPLAPAEVEPVASIFARFSTAAMSLGSLSPEAHGALAIAMNRTAGRSNSGEGGEAEENYWRDLPGGDRANHRIKQVASARFGVTADYLVAAEELQIKIAQGSKPGEGGQLPGRKVVAHIARVRHSPEGVTLISPPPHHDIYSIEDLAQLIHDLKRVNPEAVVSVKLVSSTGVGTIAAGVAKAGADTIVIGGHDGGTGASPLSSIKNAGTPWEFGLLEAHHTLVEQGLRGRVRLGVEGGLKTGRDIVMAAALGADEFAFGSAALVAAGCVMARQCHLNTCPVGIATQREELRRHFRGTPDQAIRFLTSVALEAREILGLLGRREFSEIVGDTRLLEARVLPMGARSSRVTAAPLLESASRLPLTPSRKPEERNHPAPVGGGPDHAVLSRLRFVNGHVAPLALSRPITVADRSVGALVAGELARLLRGRRLSEGTLKLHFRGAAGQSFGAFAVTGMSLTLEGEANDYVGKGLSGGEIILRPRRQARAHAASQVIAGNTLLYGATSGRLFAAGRVGERFAVRLSGALAVVEGAGDHACEYMTSGAVAILGPVGQNLGAGMSGGLAYVHDPHRTLESRINAEMVSIDPGLLAEDAAWIEEACRRHLEATGSVRAESLLRDWATSIHDFRKVVAKGLPAARPASWPVAADAPGAAPEPMWSVA
ncbi:MAG: glutamate synthase large subunit [Vicinamibacteria bacterium]|nr:glutamate synthase large subunit [Vicinamibacteria bacterium]